MFQSLRFHTRDSLRPLRSTPLCSTCTIRLTARLLRKTRSMSISVPGRRRISLSIFHSLSCGWIVRHITGKQSGKDSKGVQALTWPMLWLIDLAVLESNYTAGNGSPGKYGFKTIGLISKCRTQMGAAAR